MNCGYKSGTIDFDFHCGYSNIGIGWNFHVNKKEECTRKY